MELHTVVRGCFNGVHALEYDDQGRPMVYVNAEDAELQAAKLRERRPGEKYRVINHKAV